MSFARYFKLSSYFMIASGFAAIAATGALDLLSLGLFSAALLASWFVDTERLQRRVPGWLLNCLAVAYLPLYVLDHAILSHSYVISTIHLVFYVAALKLLTLSRDRDYFYLYLISFAELLVASTLTIDLVFSLCFFVFLLSGVSTLVLFEMRRSSAGALERGKLQPPVVPVGMEGSGLELFARFPARKVAVMSLAATLMIIVLAVPLFFLLPRASLGILNRPLGPTQFVSGFSERVSLGEIGNIKESDAVVMRVKLGEPPSELPADLKWRGIALDHYDGRTWSRSNLRRQPVTLQEGRFFKLEEFTHGSHLLSQTFFLESLTTDVVFASRKALAVSRDIGVVQRDSSGDLFTLRHAFRKVRYEAISEQSPPDPVLLNAQTGSIPEDVKASCLQLPPEDPRIAELAREVTRDQRTALEKTRALERFLRTNYSYSLQLRGSPNSQDPLAMFLFDVRRGHCEYFASAMTIMLRDLGIPARLINGFRRGEYNSIGDDWTVRQYDAHSWVEAYFPPFGWYEFDPTPPDPLHSRPAFARLLGNLMDAVDLWWWEDIVNYDFWKQYQLIGTLRMKTADYHRRLKTLLAGVWQKGRFGIEEIRGSGSAFRPAVPAAVALVFGLSATFFILWRRAGFKERLLRLMRKFLARSTEAGEVSSFYAEALDLLRSRGFKRDPCDTALEFARSLGTHPVAEPFEALTVLYNRVRFGRPGAESDTDQAEALLEVLRTSIRQT